jgi:hypothetical protein
LELTLTRRTAKLEFEPTMEKTFELFDRHWKPAPAR